MGYAGERMQIPGMRALSYNGYDELDQDVDGATAARNEGRGRGSALKTLEVVVYDANAKSGEVRTMPA